MVCVSAATGYAIIIILIVINVTICLLDVIIYLLDEIYIGVLVDWHSYKLV